MSYPSRVFRSISTVLALIVVPVSLAAQQPAAPQGGQGGRGGGAAGQPPPGPPLGSPPANAGTAEQLRDVNSPIREFVVGPPYATRDSVAAPGIAKGTIQQFVMRSEDSNIFRGIRGRFDRAVAVYIPAGYVPYTATPFIVVMDGVRSYMGRMVPVLDNLIAQKRIPSMVAVFVDPGPADGPGSDRGYEYDSVNDRYVNFIESEVLPKVALDYHIRFTVDPEGRAAFGASSGSSAALGMAWFRPNLYHKVLSYSGTFVNQQRQIDSPAPRGAWEYHQTLIPNSPKKPIRIWFHVSDRDNSNNLADSTWQNWVLANMHMRDALAAKGYDYRYVYSLESGHVDRAVVGQTLPAALEWLWRDYPKDRPPLN